ncbi:hypothetical protein N9Z95_05400 [Akkermansiaceae bacterium]|nr:hypothetical protein [Akkermansiaceae bacterium]
MRNLVLLFSLTSLLQAELKIGPTLHLNATAGLTSSGDPSDVAALEHDPNDDFGLQGLDLGLNLHWSDWLQGFVNINAFTDTEGGLDAEWEEGFIKLHDLPGGFSLRAGRYLNRFGLQNSVHLHGWNFASGNLSTSRFLGEEGLATEGAELTWLYDYDQGFLALSGSFGNIAGHGHEEGGHDEHGDTVEDAYFSDTAWTVRALLSYNQTDFHQHRFGLSTAAGDNGYGGGRETELFGADYVYTWRENGLEAGGKELSLGLEYTYGSADWVHEDDPANSGNTNYGTFMAFANYRFHENWEAGLRYEKSNGRQDGAEIHMGETEYAFLVEDHQRITAALTHDFSINEFDSLVRLQYQYDDLPEDTAHSVFLQFELNFGRGEIR